MIRTIFPAILMSSILISTALALPVSTTIKEHKAENLTIIGYNYDKHYNKQQKKYYKNERKYYNKHYDNRYYYGGRYWGHRYYARPYGWQTLGCVAVGPIWYCP